MYVRLLQNSIPEDISFDNRFFIGRTFSNVPDIDGLVYIKNDKKINKDYHALIGLELLEGEKQDESFRNIEQNVRKVHSKR